MATRNIVPRATGEGSIGTAAKHWGAGHFDSLPNWQEYLVESTGYGIVSGCEPSISGLTVTVGAGIVHLADGTRKELSATNITLDAADSTNPRIDLVYIDSTGVVAKVTGTAAASPVVPALPSQGISVAQVSVAAGASTGTITDMRDILPRFYNTGVVNVKDFGAKGDGVTDDTMALQAAIDYANQNSYGVVIFTNGVYKINRDGIRLKSNLFLLGSGHAVIKSPDTYSDNLYAMLHNGGYGENYEVENIKIIGIEFQQSIADFYQYVHIIRLCGVKNILIRHCKFNDWCSDAINIAESQNLEIVNENIHIEENIFDGYDKNNRNAITVTEGKKIWIKDNIIQNTTRNDMPGAIDIEPNNADLVIEDIHITGNTINNCSGKYGGIAVMISQNDRWTNGNIAKSIFVENNSVSNCDIFGLTCIVVNNYGIDLEQVDYEATPYIIKNNILHDSAMLICGGKGLIVSNNTIVYQKNYNKPAVLIGAEKAAESATTDGTNNIYTCVDLRFENNEIYIHGTLYAYPIKMYNSYNLRFVGNAIKSNDKDANNRGNIYFEKNGITLQPRFIANEFNQPVYVDGTHYIGDGDTFVIANNFYRGMDYNGTFLGNISRGVRDGRRYADTYLTSGVYHFAGEMVYKRNPTAGGEIGWVCVSDGNPGTWKAFGAIQS